MLKQEFNKAEELIIELKAYVNTEIELAKLKTAEKLSKLFSNFIAAIFLGAVFSLFLLFISFSVSYLLGEALGKMWLGFLIVSLFYLALGFVGWYAREKLLRVPIMNMIIRQLFHKTDPEKET